MSYTCREEVYSQQNSKLPLGLSGHRIVCDWEDTGVYLVGGYNPTQDTGLDEFDRHYVRQVWKYNISTKIWTQMKSDDPPTSLASHTLTKLNSRHLLVYGGSLSTRNVSGNSNETFLYDVRNETWSRLETTGDPCQLDCGHWFGQAMQKIEDKLIVSTGITEWHANAGLKVHQLNLHNLVWENLSTASKGEPGGRVRHEMLVYDQKMIVFGGGLSFKYQAFPLNTLPCFDLRSRTWSTLTTIPDPANGFPKPRMCLSLVVYGDSAFVSGGYCETENEDNANWTVVQHWDDIWRLHLPTMRWNLLLCKLLVPLWFHAADINSEGQMYVFGGCTDLEYEVRTNKMYKISLNSLPRLEDASWHAVLKHCRNRNLNSYSDEQLINIGLSKKYLAKLRW